MTRSHLFCRHYKRMKIASRQKFWSSLVGCLAKSSVWWCRFWDWNQDRNWKTSFEGIEKSHWNSPTMIDDIDFHLDFRYTVFECEIGCSTFDDVIFLIELEKFININLILPCIRLVHHTCRSDTLIIYHPYLASSLKELHQNTAAT